MAARTSEKTPILPTTQQPGGTPRASLATRLRQPRTLLAIAAITFLAATVLILSLHTSASSPSSSAPIVSTLFPAKEDGTRDMVQFCEEKYITQEIDHFRANGGGGDTFEQRYFVCSQDTFDPKTGAIFFYVGNEADVLLYLNNTGLMWENAKAFNALLVFAEHRYFGKSIPFGDKVLDHMEFLASTQALADYAVLVEDLKDKMDVDVPVIGFGGSYGGMLGTWFRTKYPHIVDGVIAASAPILAFMGDKKHPVDTEGFQRGVTFDLSEQAGSAANCVPNVRRAFASIVDLGKTDAGRQELAALLRVCDSNALETEKDVSAVVDAVADAYGNLAMGNYPYPTSYITSGESFLPAYPVRAACEHLKADFADDDYAGLLAAFRDSVGVFYNSTGQEKCYFPTESPANVTDIDIKGNFWGYLECSELYMPMGSDGIHDVFPAQPANATVDDANCFETWGVHLRPRYANMEYGGVKALRATSNIVFSNGNYDPWSAAGVLETLSDSVVFVPIEGGAHHLDLFFTHPLDPPAVTEAREIEKQHIKKWIGEFYANKQKNEGI